MFEHIRNSKKIIQYSLIIFGVGLSLILSFYLLQNLNVIIQALKEFIGVVTPVIIAFMIAYILWKPMLLIETKLKGLIKKLTKRELSSGLARGFSILITFYLVGMAILLLINTIIPPIVTNLKLLIESIPALQQTLNRYIDEIGPYIQSFITEEQINEITHALLYRLTLSAFLYLLRSK